MDEIKNEKAEINKGRCMCEEDIIGEILLSEKNISNSYSVMINEMSNKSLYKKILLIYNDTKNMARELYNLMFQKGWYSLTKEDEVKIESSFSKYKNKLKELS